MQTKKHPVFSGVMLLTLSNLFVKVIGLVFKIPLQSVLTDEGMGYFNAAYSIYLWFYTISTAGLPVAVSLLVAKSYAKGDVRSLASIYKTTMLLLCGIGAVFGAGMFFCAPLLAKGIGTPSTAAAIAVIAPTVFFVCLSGGIRGYFQGMGNMLPTAVSQVLEAVCKLGLGMALATFSLRRGDPLPTVAAFAVSGLTVGSALGTIFLFACHTRSKLQPMPLTDPTSPPTAKRAIARQLLQIALPVTLSASVMSLTGLIDVGVVIRRLRRSGLAETAAVALYGNYTTLAVPMFHLPPTLITPIACAIVPPLTAALERGDTVAEQRLRHTTLRIGMILLLPCAVGLSVLAHPVLSLFFAQPSVDLAAPLLSVLALSVPFVGLLSITNSLLQVYGLERKPIFSMLCGAVVKLIASIALIGMPSVGIFGAPIGTLLCYGTIAMINLAYVRRYLGDLGAGRDWLYRPFAASIGCAASASLARYALLGAMGARGATLLAICTAVAVYFGLLLLMGGVSAEDLSQIEPLKKIMDKIKKGLFGACLVKKREAHAAEPSAKERKWDSNGEL